MQLILTICLVLSSTYAFKKDFVQQFNLTIFLCQLPHLYFTSSPIPPHALGNAACNALILTICLVLYLRGFNLFRVKNSQKTKTSIFSVLEPYSKVQMLQKCLHNCLNIQEISDYFLGNIQTRSRHSYFLNWKLQIILIELALNYSVTTSEN